MLQRYAAATGAPLLAVAGNVDDKLDAAEQQLLPGHRLAQLAGWKVLLVHIVASGPGSKGGAPNHLSLLDMALYQTQAQRAAHHSNATRPVLNLTK